MLKITTKALAVLFFATAAKCFAFPFVEADAFTSGDKKAVLDTATGIEWLDFDVNNAVSFNEVLASLNTTYQGWRLPTETEVKGLWARLFDVGDDKYEIFDLWGANKAPSDNLPYLCYGYFLDDKGHLEHGMLIESGTKVAGYGASRYYLDGDIYSNVSSNSGPFYDGANIPPFNLYGTEEISTLLVRDTNVINAPEPSSLLLFGLGFAGLLLGRRRFLK